METIVTIVFTILTILGMVLAVKITGSMVVGILVAIIVIMIWKTVQVPLLILWDRFAAKHYPMPEIKHFYEKDLDGQNENGLLNIQLGMRVLIITETFDYSEETAPAFDVMVESAIDALKKEFPLFRLRYLAVKKRNAPIQYSSTLCGENGELMNKCYKAWVKTNAVFKMTAREKNKDMFLHDGGVEVDGEVINYTALFLFDNTLPVTVDVLNRIEKKEAEQTESTETEQAETVIAEITESTETESTETKE